MALRRDVRSVSLLSQSVVNLGVQLKINLRVQYEKCYSDL